MGYISNFKGNRVWRPLEGDYRAWAPPTAPEIITREGRMAPASSKRAATGPSRAPAKAVRAATGKATATASAGIRTRPKTAKPLTSPSRARTKKAATHNYSEF